MALTNKQRRDRDIYRFCTAKLQEKVGLKQKYTYQAVLAMAEHKFYLAPDTIADILRAYEPIPETGDPGQTNILDEIKNHTQSTRP